jgi:hypothetical protein
MRVKTQQPAPTRSSGRAQDLTRRGFDRTGFDEVDIWGIDSFPASDAPSNW